MSQELFLLLNRYKKQLMFWSIFAVIAIIFVTFAVWQQRADEREGKTAVYIHTVPKSTTISVKNFTSSKQVIYLPPGTYTATISKEGFHSYTQQLIVNPTDDVHIYAGLAPKDEQAKQWYNRHKQDYVILQQQSFQSSQEYGKKFREQWPITEILPIKDPYFTISYLVKNNESIVLTIKGTSPRYREFAIEELRKRGYEPTDYVIDFIGFKNPLEKDIYE